MVTTAIKRILPTYVKHPILAITHWYWEVRGFPAQSRGDLSIFKDILEKVPRQKLRVFEWGSGDSTIYYSEFLRTKGHQFDWYAAENSEAWRQRSQEKVSKAGLTAQVHISCSEFPAFWELPGYSYETPVPREDYTNSTEVKEYIQCPRFIGGQYDVMMIDGRFRRRCLQVAAETVAPHGIVILHDAQRANYHSSLALFPYVQFLETGALPGTKQQSTVAIASLENESLISELAEIYRRFRLLVNKANS